MKIKPCDCGQYAFVATTACDGTFCVMCKAGGTYSHRFGPSAGTYRKAVELWNKWANTGFREAG